MRGLLRLVAGWLALVALCGGTVAEAQWRPGFRPGLRLASFSASAYVAIPNYGTIAVAGDSYGAGFNASPTTTNGWAYRVAAGLGSTLTNSAVSGSSLSNNAAEGGVARPNNLRDNYPAYLLGANKKAAVFIGLGFNDARYADSPATFNVAGYINDYREILNGLIIGGYARSDIYIVSPWFCTDAGLTTNTTQTRAGFLQFVDGAATVAAEYGVRYIDAYNPGRLDPVYIADVDNNDKVHPTNYGHALIASTILNRTVEANTRAAPAGVALNVAGSTVTAVAASVPGAASYEYALVANPVEYASNTTGIFSSVPGGNYYARARAVFSDGSKGPWTFTTSAATVTGAAIMFLQDSFSSASDAALTAHAPETGGAWSVVSSSTSPLVIAATGRLRNNGTSSIMRNAAVPSSPNYYVEATVDFLSSVPNETIGVAARMNSPTTSYYWARWNRPTNAWQLWKTVSGTATQLGADSVDNFGSGSRTLRLSAIGTTISMAVDGVPLISVTDGDIADAGFAGIRNTTSQGTSTGRQMTSIVAVTQ